MAHPSVVEATEDRMQAMWTHTEWRGVNNNAAPPADGSPYVLVQFPASRNSTMSVDTRQEAEEGGIRFVVHVPAGMGKSEANTLVRHLRTIFRRAKFGGVETGPMSSPTYDDANDVGPFFLASVVFPYVFHTEES
jgi:hypothetical protein